MRTMLAIAVSTMLVLSGTALGAEFRLMAPASDSGVDLAQTLVIVKLDGAPDVKQVEILNNGKSVVLSPVVGGAVVQLVPLKEGPNELTLAAPGVKRLSFKVSREKGGSYVYHADASDPKGCSSCHLAPDKGGWKLKKDREGKICVDCHDLKNELRYVHGPVAVDSCSPCHDPHGSSRPDFLVATGKALCLSCHSQNMSASHIGERANENCLRCHGPHSSMLEFHMRHP